MLLISFGRREKWRQQRNIYFGIQNGYFGPRNGYFRVRNGYFRARNGYFRAGEEKRRLLGWQVMEHKTFTPVGSVLLFPKKCP